jgi:4-hydroxybenzoate polyprenyltransferase
MTNTLNPYLSLMRLHQPVGTLLLLWPTLGALWMVSDEQPTVVLIGVFTLGTIIMRAAGCVINDVADQKFDGQVQRTAQRPLATGAISTKNALILCTTLALSALVLLLFLNALTRWLAVAGLAIVALYPFLKRWTYLPQVVLGAAFSWGIPMAFAAVGGTVPAVGWLLFIASLLWIVAYDTMYAMVDRDEDLKIGIRSTAILFGSADRLMVGILQAAALVTFLLVGQQLDYQYYYFLGLACAAGLFVYQQILIRSREPENCFRAFTNNVWVGFSLFTGIVLEVHLAPLLTTLGTTL